MSIKSTLRDNEKEFEKEINVDKSMGNNLSHTQSKWIKQHLHQSQVNLLESVLEAIEEKKKSESGWADEEYFIRTMGYNQALDDIKSLIKNSL